MERVKEQYEADWQARLRASEEAAEEREEALRAEIVQEWNLMDKVKEKYDAGWQERVDALETTIRGFGDVGE